MRSMAPVPMPNCRSPSGPNKSLTQTKFQPRMPMKKPWAINQPKPSAPQMIKILPCIGSERGRECASNGPIRNGRCPSNQSFLPAKAKNMAGA